MRLPSAPEGRRRAAPAAPPAAPAARPRPVAAPPVPASVAPPAGPSVDPWAVHAAAAEERPAPPPPRPDPARIHVPPPESPEPPPRRRLFGRERRSAESAVARLRALPERAPPPEQAAEADTSPAAPLLAPVRPLLEGFGLLGLLLILDLALGGRGFAYWPVHPFALPVLLVAARHGLVPGVIVALAAALLRIGLALVHDHWTAEAWAEPVAWPFAALLVGGLVEHHRHRLAGADSAAEAARAERAAVVEANDRLAVRAVELEARLGARLTAATSVFEAARALGHGTEGVIRGACGLLRAATGCTACSFWLAEDGALHLVAAEGWPDGAPLSHSFARGPLAGAIGASRGALLVTRPADRLALGGEGIMAAPVLSPWDGMLLGMVKVEDIGFADLAPDTVAALEAAAGWLGAALAESRAREAQGAGPDSSAGLSVLAGEEAGRAIRMVTGLARRVGLDLVLLSAEIPAGPRAAGALEATRAAMAETFRGSDLLLEARLDERRISVLLMGAQVVGAEAAAARLRAHLASRAPGATGDVVVGLAWLHAAAR